jgi:aryl-alcohol dehydrogenase-like predicted oxidoreductase
MRTKKLGWTELELTTVGLGTWAIGGGGWAYAWGPQDDQTSIQAIHPVASLQPPCSMLVRQAEQKLLPYCAAQRIGVVAYSPMQKGLLTGKITGDRVRQFPPDDHRRRDPEFQEPLLSANLQLVEDLQSLASKLGRTVAQLAIAWVLRRPEVTSAIVGARHPSQVEEIVGAADWALSQREIDIIGDLLRKRQSGIIQA